ncbi:hypothetical protein SUGI_0540080 [Cryptomeria japonica]|nr:hypothetical protein SUGI_0540080 [Cryptomeria japonica]
MTTHLNNMVALIEKEVVTKKVCLMLRGIRHMMTLWKRIRATHLISFPSHLFPAISDVSSRLLSYFPKEEEILRQLSQRGNGSAEFSSMKYIVTDSYDNDNDGLESASESISAMTNDDFVGRVVSDKGRYPEVTCKVQMGNQILTTRIYATSPLWTKDLSKEGAQNGPLLMPVSSRVASDCIYDMDYLLMAEYADTVTLELSASRIVEDPGDICRGDLETIKPLLDGCNNSVFQIPGLSDENNGSRITSGSCEWSHQWIVNYGKVGFQNDGLEQVHEFSSGRGDEKLLEEEWFEEFPLSPFVQPLMQTTAGISEDTTVKRGYCSKQL